MSWTMIEFQPSALVNEQSTSRGSTSVIELDAWQSVVPFTPVHLRMSRPKCLPVVSSTDDAENATTSLDVAGSTSSARYGLKLSNPEVARTAEAAAAAANTKSASTATAEVERIST
eukprot:Amastigsp_a174379_739.p3 type:complete len:116 gc:universal Amastigsp_a174379_739:1342-1689(+)